MAFKHRHVTLFINFKRKVCRYLSKTVIHLLYTTCATAQWSWWIFQQGNSDFDSSQRCHGPSFAGPFSLTSKTMMVVADVVVEVADAAAAAFLLELSTWRRLLQSIQTFLQCQLDLQLLQWHPRDFQFQWDLDLQCFQEQLRISPSSSLHHMFCFFHTMFPTCINCEEAIMCSQHLWFSNMLPSQHVYTSFQFLRLVMLRAGGAEHAGAAAVEPAQKGKGSGKHGKDGKNGQDGGKGSTSDGSLLGARQLNTWQFSKKHVHFGPIWPIYPKLVVSWPSSSQKLFQNNEPRARGASAVPEMDHPPPKSTTPAPEVVSNARGKSSKAVNYIEISFVLNMFVDDFFMCFKFSFPSLPKVEQDLLPLGLWWRPSRCHQHQRGPCHRPPRHLRAWFESLGLP